ncbi:hypothetical protein VEE23_31940 [Escherichia coli]|nr:hypothetical protein VEE23_31940 [Escherichia coli]
MPVLFISMCEYTAHPIKQEKNTGTINLIYLFKRNAKKRIESNRLEKLEDKTKPLNTKNT